MSSATTAFRRGFFSTALPHASDRERDPEPPEDKHFNSGGFFAPSGAQFRETNGLTFTSGLPFVDDAPFEVSPATNVDVFRSPNSIGDDFPVKQAEAEHGQKHLEAVITVSSRATSLLSSPDQLSGKTEIFAATRHAVSGRKLETNEHMGTGTSKATTRSFTPTNHTKHRAEHTNRLRLANVEKGKARSSTLGKRSGGGSKFGGKASRHAKISSYAPLTKRSPEQKISRRLFPTVGLDPMMLSDTGPAAIAEKQREIKTTKSHAVADADDDGDGDLMFQGSSNSSTPPEMSGMRCSALRGHRETTTGCHSSVESSSSDDSSDESNWEAMERRPPQTPARSRRRPPKTAAAQNNKTPKPAKRAPLQMSATRPMRKRGRPKSAVISHRTSVVAMSSATAVTVVGKPGATFAQALAVLDAQILKKRKVGRPSNAELQQRRKADAMRAKLEREMKTLETGLTDKSFAAQTSLKVEQESPSRTNPRKTQPVLLDSSASSASSVSSSSPSDACSDSLDESSSGSSSDDESLSLTARAGRKRSVKTSRSGTPLPSPPTGPDSPKNLLSGAASEPLTCTNTANHAVSTVAPPFKRKCGRPRKHARIQTPAAHTAGQMAGKSIPLLLSKRRLREQAEAQADASAQAQSAQPRTLTPCPASEPVTKKRRGRPPKVAKKGSAVVQMAHKLARGEAGGQAHGKTHSRGGDGNDKDKDRAGQDGAVRTRRRDAAREEKGRTGQKLGGEKMVDVRVGYQEKGKEEEVDEDGGKESVKMLQAAVRRKEELIGHLQRALEAADEQLRMESSRALELEEALGLGLPLGREAAEREEEVKKREREREREREVDELKRQVRRWEEESREKEAALRGFAGQVRELEGLLQAGRKGEETVPLEVRRLEEEVERLRLMVRNVGRENRELRREIGTVKGGG